MSMAWSNEAAEWVYVGWRSRSLKNWRALGPWFHSRFRILFTRSDVQQTELVFIFWVRACESNFRMRSERLAASPSASGRGGGGVEAVRL